MFFFWFFCVASGDERKGVAVNVKSRTLIFTFQPNLHSASAGSGRSIKSAELRPPTVQRFTLFVCRAAECLLEVPQTPSLREPMELE